MIYFDKIAVTLLLLILIPTSGRTDISALKSSPSRQTIIKDCFATGYFCVYNSEIEGEQTITKNISGVNFTLKASFLFGGRGVAMQGTGRVSPHGYYIKYSGGGGEFIRLYGPNAGKNLHGRWVMNPDALRDKYARLGITDFSGFGNLALANPEDATFVVTSSVMGSSGRPLKPWHSISVDPALISLGQTVTIRFKNNVRNFLIASADDIGSAIKGKHIEIYLGEGQDAFEFWDRSGGNCFVDILTD